jgi:methionyl-tRNA formyltransferase
MNIKIHEAHVITDFTDNQPGEIIDITKSGIKVVCGEKTIINITKLQLPGKKAVLVKEMINGNHLFKLNGRFTY